LKIIKTFSFALIPSFLGTISENPQQLPILQLSSLRSIFSFYALNMAAEKRRQFLPKS